MKLFKVVSRKNTTASLPITSTLVAILALDRWSAPGWVWGALGVIFLVAWISSIIKLYNQEEIDIFAKPTEEDITRDFLLKSANSKESDFQTKLKKAMGKVKQSPE